jgi:hypothetical protein
METVFEAFRRIQNPGQVVRGLVQDFLSDDSRVSIDIIVMDHGKRYYKMSVVKTDWGVFWHPPAAHIGSPYRFESLNMQTLNTLEEASEAVRAMALVAAAWTFKSELTYDIVAELSPSSNIFRPS